MMRCHFNMLGFVINKNKDLNQGLFWKLLESNFDYNFVNEDYQYCVAREYVKMILDCKQNNIPYFINLNRKEGNPEVIDVFCVRQNDLNPKWWEFFKEDIGREIIYITDKSKLINYIDYFIKSENKYFAIKDLVDYAKNIYEEDPFNQRLMNSIEDNNVDFDKFLLDPRSYPKVLIDLIPSRYKQGFSHVEKINYLASPKMDFDFDQEIRVVFNQNKIATISYKVDYEDKPIDQTTIEYCKKMANKYGFKVPFKIWNLDIVKLHDFYHIVEAHFCCNLLGKFKGNQSFNKYL